MTIEEAERRRERCLERARQVDADPSISRRRAEAHRHAWLNYARELAGTIRSLKETQDATTQSYD